MAVDAETAPLDTSQKAKLNGILATSHQIQGPMVNGRPTTATLLDPKELESSDLLVPLTVMINSAFDVSHSSSNILGGTKRLDRHEDLPIQIGGADGTFTYLVSYADESIKTSQQALGTVSARPYNVPASRDDLPSYIKKESAFSRLRAPIRRIPDAQTLELWELKFLAVDPTLQKQGLAVYLMNLAEAEARRRSEAKRKTKPGDESVELVMVLTTIEDLVGPFYVRRGYELDYKTFQDVGYMGTEVGFTVAHYSKLLKG